MFVPSDSQIPNHFVTITGARKKGDDEAMADKSGKSADKSQSLGEVIQGQAPEMVQQLSMNLSQALVESQQLMAEAMGRGPAAMGDPADHPLAIGSGRSMARVGQSLASHPDRIASANLVLWQDYVRLWGDLMSGQHRDGARDRRFADSEWNTNPMFEFMRRSYEINTKWLMSLVDGAEEIGEQDQRKARFMAVRRLMPSPQPIFSRRTRRR